MTSASRRSALRARPIDLGLVVCFAIFAFTSLVMEMYITFEIDLAASTDPFGRLWHFYAASWDPIFLDVPLYLWVMCTIDAFVFGPFYLVLIYALVRERDWIRIPAFVYVSAIVYSTIVYFGIELIGERHRANMWMVVAVNIPYTIVPLVLAWRLRRPAPFGSAAA